MITRCCLEGDSLDQIRASEVQSQRAEVFVLVAGTLLHSRTRDYRMTVVWTVVSSCRSQESWLISRADLYDCRRDVSLGVSVWGGF